MIHLRGQAAGEPEIEVAEAVCDECEEEIVQWMTILEENLPPVYTWKHKSDGTVLCERPRVATPRPGTVRGL